MKSIERWVRWGNLGGRGKICYTAKQFRLRRECKRSKKGKTVPPSAGVQKKQKRQNSSAFGGRAKHAKYAKQFRLRREGKTRKIRKTVPPSAGGQKKQNTQNTQKLPSAFRRRLLLILLFCLFCSPSFTFAYFAILLVLLSVFHFCLFCLFCSPSFAFALY